MCQKRNHLTKQILHCPSELSKICPAVLAQSIRAIQETNSKLFNHLNEIKAQKPDQLIGPQIASHSSPENLKTVVTIPENLSLSDSEKSVLSKGPQRVWFFSRFGHKLGIDFSHFAAILVINRVSIFAL